MMRVTLVNVQIRSRTVKTLIFLFILLERFEIINIHAVIARLLHNGWISIRN